MLVTVEITQEIIDLGCEMTKEGSRSQNCPGAIAIQNLLKQEIGVMVSDVHVTYFSTKIIRYGGKRVLDFDQQLLVAESPQELKTFVHEFDSKENAGPITFQMDIPEEYLA